MINRVTELRTKTPKETSCERNDYSELANEALEIARHTAIVFAMNIAVRLNRYILADEAA